MSWFQTLDQIAAADPSLVGLSAYYLGQLKQKRLPVAAGWVVTTEAWKQILQQVVWPDPDRVDSLLEVDLSAIESLQQISRGWQQAMQAVQDVSSLSVEGINHPPTQWMLRPSLWLAAQASPAAHPCLPLHGLLSETIGAGAGPHLWQGLMRFWSQALTARSLVVWRQYCQFLSHLGVGTLVLPLYPAQVTGRLTLIAGTCRVEAVAGLGLPMAQGEAIPARCQVELGELSNVIWKTGYQELIYGIKETAAVEPNAGEAGAEERLLQVVERPHPELSAPLSNTQLASLCQLAEQVQEVLPGDGIQVEWLLYPSALSDQLEWVITQALPWPGPNPGPPRRKVAYQQPVAATAGRRPPPLAPPPLPQVSVVVRGIGAASGRVQAAAVVAQHPQDLPNPLPPGCIVVLPDLQPDRFLQLKSVVGIVIEQGGATCHAAILAREMGIPAVVGAPQATQLLDPDLVLWLDGERGLVYGITQEMSAKLEGDTPPAAREPGSESGSARLSPSLSIDTSHWHPLRTKVLVNLSQASRVKDLPLDRIDGIGLLRSEWLMLEILDRRHPWHWVDQGQGAELQARLTQTLAPILQTLGDKPVRYRSLDLRSHEWQALEGSPPADANPMLGLRGALSYGIDSRLFEIELGALASLQQAGYHNLQLMLPFVRSVEEVITCRQYIDYAGLRQDEGFALWIMAEVPSVLFLLPAYARVGVQGIAIGSNDLTQLLLAVDRDQRTMASAYDERHPVVRLALAHLIQEARRSGMTCSICGQAPVRHPELIADLVAWGISSISVEAGALPFTREAIWQAEQGEI